MLIKTVQGRKLAEMMIELWDQLIVQYRRLYAFSAPGFSVLGAGAQNVSLSLINSDLGATPAAFGDNKDVMQSQQGDPEAYRRLIERHQARVAKLLWRFTRDKDSHEDLVQETFVQAYFSLHTYKAQAPFEHWLTCIATRVGYKFWKNAQKHRHADLLECDWEQLSKAEPETTTPEQAAELLNTLLVQLPPRDRLVLTLRFIEQCDIEETARRTGWSQALVKVQTHRAKQKLKKLLEKADMELDTL